MTDEAQFLAALPVIDDVIGQVRRRHRLSATETEEFRSDVRFHFIARNYEVLRKFEGRSSLATYVTVVVQRLFLDRRNKLWGKWRPSADARRLGPTAMRLERLISRDGWTAEQALETLRVNHGVTIDESLRGLCDKLAGRGPSRQLVSDDGADAIAGNGPATDVNVVRAEHDFLAKRVQSALERARHALSAEEQLILKMRFDDRIAVANIARALHLDQKRLYRIIERLLNTIQTSLAAEGIGRADISALFAGEGLSWSSDGEAEVDAGPTHAAEPKRAS